MTVGQHPRAQARRVRSTLSSDSELKTCQGRRAENETLKSLLRAKAMATQTITLPHLRRPYKPLWLVLKPAKCEPHELDAQELTHDLEETPLRHSKRDVSMSLGGLGLNLAAKSHILLPFASILRLFAILGSREEAAAGIPALCGLQQRCGRVITTCAEAMAGELELWYCRGPALRALRTSVCIAIIALGPPSRLMSWPIRPWRAIRSPRRAQATRQSWAPARTPPFSRALPLWRCPRRLWPVGRRVL